jgi:hypothetical protein
MTGRFCGLRKGYFELICRVSAKLVEGLFISWPALQVHVQASLVDLLPNTIYYCNSSFLPRVSGVSSNFII